MGLQIDILWLTVLMFGSLALLLTMGLPLAFVTGGLACVFLSIFGGRFANIADQATPPPATKATSASGKANLIASALRHSVCETCPME